MNVSKILAAVCTVVAFGPSLPVTNAYRGTGIAEELSREEEIGRFIYKGEYCPTAGIPITVYGDVVATITYEQWRKSAEDFNEEHKYRFVNPITLLDHSVHIYGKEPAHCVSLSVILSVMEQAMFRQRAPDMAMSFRGRFPTRIVIGNVGEQQPTLRRPFPPH